MSNPGARPREGPQAPACDEPLMAAERFDAVLRSLGVERVAVTVMTGRCGSTLLGSVANAVGFGCGEECFNFLADGIERPDDEKALRQAVRWATRSGIMHYQVTPNRLVKLSRSFPFGGLTGGSVSLNFRRNVVAQAISFVTAIRSGTWHSHLPARAPRPIEDDQVARATVRFVRRTLAQESLALELFPNAPIVFYEDLVASPLETMEGFFRYHDHPVTLMRLDEVLRSEALPARLPKEDYARRVDEVLAFAPRLRKILDARLRSDFSRRARSLSAGFARPPVPRDLPPANDGH